MSKYALFMPCLFIFLQLPQLNAQVDCDPQEETFTVTLPAVNAGAGWWQGVGPVDETIEIPNGRPIYALIVSGFASNAYLDEMMLYNFATYLMSKGAYVHYAWWNNLLAPYMARPLHDPQCYPGELSLWGTIGPFRTREKADRKALPGEDYQFVADAEIFLQEIRNHNPNAIIIVAGHSMGGGAVVHLAMETNVVIDLLAPIDPVGNRNVPFAGPYYESRPFYNWTRWRVSRDNFRGFYCSKWVHTGGLGWFHGHVEQGTGSDCGPFETTAAARHASDPICNLFSRAMFYDDAATLVFKSNIINLHHRFQQEARFPFDFKKEYRFGHTPPSNGPNPGTNSQEAVATKKLGIDSSGWPSLGLHERECCPIGIGVAWPQDGHGEIVGYRGSIVPNVVPLGVRLRTSPQCGKHCDNLIWPVREYNKDTKAWVVDTVAEHSRDSLEREIEGLALILGDSLLSNLSWVHKPANPDLCLVSDTLIAKFKVINKPPHIDTIYSDVHCDSGTGQVELIGSSTDPDGVDDILSYTWEVDSIEQEGDTALIGLPTGSYCIKLTVKDKVGHSDVKSINVEINCSTQNIALRSQTVNTNFDFSIHPNPASQEIFISVGKGTVVNQVNLYNQVGQRVIHKNRLDGSIDVSALPQGFYVVELVSEHAKARKKVVVYHE